MRISSAGCACHSRKKTVSAIIQETAMRKQGRKSQSPVSLISFQDIITSLCGIMILLVLFLAIELVARKSIITVESCSTSHQLPSHRVENITDQKKIEYLKEKLKDTRILSPLEAAKIMVDVETLNRKYTEQKKVFSQHIQQLEKQLVRIEQTKKRCQTDIMEIKTTLSKLENNKTSMSQDNRVTFIPTEKTTFRPFLVECSGTIMRAGYLNDDNPPEIFSVDTDGKNSLLNVIRNIDAAKNYVVFIIKPSGADYAMEIIRKVRQMGVNVGYDAMTENHCVAFGKPKSSTL
jgi:hypothetical protein